MRNTIVIVVTAFVFAALCYGGVLQDRMLRKARRAGDSIFSPGIAFRAVATKEAWLFVLLVSVMSAIIAVFIALDKLGYLGS